LEGKKRCCGWRLEAGEALLGLKRQAVKDETSESAAMNSVLFFSFMTSLLICMAMIPPLRLLAGRFHIMDQPGERKVHQYPVPRVGGIAFGIGAIASILWWGPKDGTTLSVLLGGLIILVFGAWDDRANLGYRIKLFGQLVAALAVIIIGGIRFESIPFLLNAELPRMR
jgi:UDP-GlcNAc:undecaprenyl-phosphate GlcNAc-1-phosphate transferase